MSKKKRARSAWRHFRERLEERYGFQISHEEWKSLPAQMSNGAGHICNARNNMSWWCIITSKGIVFAQYSKTGRYFVSVQPTDMLKAAMKGERRAREYIGLTKVTPTHRKWYGKIYGEPFTEGTRDLERVCQAPSNRGSTRDQRGRPGSERRDSRLLGRILAMAGRVVSRWNVLFKLWRR